jgi:methionyl-tRNA formyltransferase
MKSFSQDIKFVYIGTPEFGASVLNKLCEKELKPVLVITSPDKPIGRKQIVTPPPVKVIAEQYKIPVLQTEKIQTFKSEITDLKPDLMIVCAFGQIIPKEILDIPSQGSLNVHPSLLPKHRGPSPIQSAIIDGDKVTGVTIMLMDEKMDHGPIVAQRTMALEEKESFEALSANLADMGANLLSEIIPKWLKKMIVPKPQQDSESTYTRILTKETGRINWKKSAEILEREVRAYQSWPGSYTFWDKRGVLSKIEILKSRVFKSPISSTYPTGKTLVVPQNEIGVQCGKGFSDESGDFLVIERIKMEGQKEMSSEEFLRGRPDFIGAILQ